MDALATEQRAFDLNQDQRSMRDMVLDFAREKVAPYALDWDEKRYLPLDVIRETAELGMGGVYVREDVGGSALSRLDAAVIFQALATGCPALSSFITIHNMAAWMIDTYGTEEQRQRFLPSLTSMEKIASYCLTEPGSGSDAAAMKTTARLDGDHYVLNGTKQFISGAGSNDVYLVMARTGGEGAKGVSCFIVEKDALGLSFGAQERKMGWHIQPTAQVIFDDCRVPVENRIGEEGTGFRIAMSGLDGGRLNISACSIGGAEAALEMAQNYAAERKAFGQAIGQFQAIQFKMADMATELEAARLMLYSAASKLDAKAPDTTQACAMAKRFATDVGFNVANEALQIHGGYGYLAEYGVEKIVRDLRVHQILEGTNEIMRVIIARSMAA
ncbi:isobutyryl-CoA dehydrogenase [Pseudahrensia aquimaris]|uniref:Isobutyryl-CoA dehydrogenase n=1 Tax=Pseudahrensia aquimaris TaxID=744461 RepID=A0ABW3FNK7_9HYPH